MSVPPAFKLREMTPDDSPAIATLTEESPDGGRITFSPRFHIPAHEVYKARHTEMVGVVAEVNNKRGLVGAAHVSFGECQFEGSVHPYALLSALMVHPSYRRQGIARALAQRRIDWAVERSGSDTIILADIQQGNVGSLANAKKWAGQILGRMITAPLAMRTKPFRLENGLTVREAAADELETIAENLNTFYRDYNLYRPQSADNLQHWLRETPLPTPINHYWVITDRNNRLLAGLGIREEGRLMSLAVSKMPALIRLANRFLKVVPLNGEMRNLQVDKLWLAPGQLSAARQLVQALRWEWRDRGSSLLFNYDPRSPITQVLENPAWMPTTSGSIAVRAPLPMSEARLIDPIV